MNTNMGRPKLNTMYDTFIIHLFAWILKIINALKFDNYRIHD